ncbi:MAG TPA: FAD/NAD(P)-binding protein [Solirubrobacterales bacterium]|nr:FAD/NAD(P)-binding protein [Solirubrobacterales bacterium]
MADSMLPVPYVVADKRQELGDTWTLELEPANGDGVAGFRPGQFSMLYAFGTGEVPISVSRIAGGSVLVHTVRAVGAATRAICATEPGRQLGVRGPFGNSWPLAEAEGGDVVVVAGGIGLAPLRAAIHHLIDNRDSYRAVVVLYGARSPDEMLFFDELQGWREAGIDVKFTVDTAAGEWDGRVGLVTKLIPIAGFEGARTTAMVCGPEVMMRFVSAALQDRGIPAESVHVSLERNMKCAIGHCGHCQLAHRFVCKDGPVFSVGRIGTLLGVREL